MSGDIFIAIDQGSHASRAIAFDQRGQRLAATLQTVGTSHNALGHVEHDAEEVVATVCACLDDLAAQLPASRWSAAGLATQRSTIVCWDRASGRALSPAISWRDRRQSAWLTRLDRHAQEVHALTGLPLSPHYGASKLRWCLDHLPAVRAAHAAGSLCAGPLSSFLLFRLLREQPFLVDPANASRTQLWSPQTRDFHPGLLDLFGVPRAILPLPALTQQRFGTLAVGGHETPLVACTGDQAAVPFAGGALEPGVAYLNIGTGAFLLRAISQAVAAAPLLTSVLRANATTIDYVLEGTVNGAMAALDEFAANEGVAVDELLAAVDDDESITTHAPFFLNGVGGLGAPFWVPDFQSRFEGNGTVRDRFRAVIESIAFLVRANLDEMGRHLPPPVQLITTGGLSRNRLLRRLLARLTGVPVACAAESEATGRGIAFLAAHQPPSWDRGRVETVQPVTDQIQQARYVKWLDLMQSCIARR